MRRQYSVALQLADEFAVKFFNRGRFQIAGSIRRKEETIGDVDLITIENLDDIAKRIEVNSYARKVNGGQKKMDVDYKFMRFNIYHAEPEYWGAMLFFLTGPAGYSIAYRRKAKEKGWKLDQYGLVDQNLRLLAARTEEDIYKAFGKPYKAPEVRGK